MNGLAIVFICGLCLGVIGGYCCARLDYVYVRLREWHEGVSQLQRATGFFSERMERNTRQTATRNQAQVVAEKIDIDERKVVTEINTKDIQKVSEIELGVTTATQDTIGESASKLAQLKGR
ncbi:MAG: hypothetical protein EBU90_31195 [Proteobacteria bacterium]|nr:hypothetical protein [Pseudomonadota bacterium]